MKMGQEVISSSKGKVITCEEYKRTKGKKKASSKLKLIK
jgi:hypothetical protein